MQTSENVLFADSRGRKQNEELIGVLNAIAIVSKRLAGRLAALEHQREEKSRGGKIYVTRQSAATRQ
jgi:hypothetical protein